MSFNKDTNLIFEAYSQTRIVEGKMKELQVAIDDGDSPEQICKDMNIDPTPSMLKFISDLAHAKKEEDAEHVGDLDKDGEMSEYEMKRHKAIKKAMGDEEAEYSVPADDDDTDESKQEAAAAARQGFNPDENAEDHDAEDMESCDDEHEDDEDKTGHLSDKELLKKVKGMGTAGDALIDAAEKRLKDGMSLTAHERDALGRDAYGAAEKEIAKESVSYTSRYII